MNELKDKAAYYAAEKTNEIIAKAIAQAYADGYRDGYKECQDKMIVDLSYNNIELTRVFSGFKLPVHIILKT